MNDMTHEICINLTRRCNLHCEFCYVHDLVNKKNNDLHLDLSLEKIKKLVDFSAVEGVYLTGGEPFMHPDIKEIINYFFENGKKINIATNALLLNEEMFRFLNHKNITLLISLREEYSETFRIINQLKDFDIEVICYHLPSDTSPDILLKLVSECPSVKKIKLLYDSKSPKKAPEWFAILHKIYNKIKVYAGHIDIIVEIGFLPRNNVLALDERRGAFDRIQISTEGRYYYCPLLVSNTEGRMELPPIKCQPDTCPVLSKKLDDESLTSVCCFLVTSLENAIKVGKYGGVV